MTKSLNKSFLKIILAYLKNRITEIEKNIAPLFKSYKDVQRKTTGESTSSTDTGTSTSIVSQEKERSPKKFVQESFPINQNSPGFIDLQGKESVTQKLNRILGLGESVVLLVDVPEDNMYRGYVCTVLEVFLKVVDDQIIVTHCQIEFYSHFSDDDSSQKSKSKNDSFEFPTSSEICSFLFFDIYSWIIPTL